MRAAARGGRAGWLLAAAWLLVGLPAEAGRPLVVDDAESVDAGRVQIETGLELTRAPDSTTLALPLSLAFGLADWLEVGVAPAGLYVANDSTSPRQAVGAGDVLLAAKLALPFEPFGLALALAHRPRPLAGRDDEVLGDPVEDEGQSHDEADRDDRGVQRGCPSPRETEHGRQLHQEGERRPEDDQPRRERAEDLVAAIQ